MSNQSYPDPKVHVAVLIYDHVAPDIYCVLQKESRQLGKDRWKFPTTPLLYREGIAGAVSRLTRKEVGIECRYDKVLDISEDFDKASALHTITILVQATLIPGQDTDLREGFTWHDIGDLPCDTGDVPRDLCPVTASLLYGAGLLGQGCS